MAQAVPVESTDAGADVPPGGYPPRAWAWGVCWLMFAATALNYMDRQTIALVKPKIVEEYGLSNEAFGWVLAAFQLTYAFCQVPAGYVVDRVNTRAAYAGAVGWWSLAGIAAAFSPSLGLLLAMRAMLGVGESFNWPCALKVTGTILPPADRGLGNGIFNSGAAVGAILTPLIVPPLAVAFGWRIPFVVVGGLGFAWIVAWLAYVRWRHAPLFVGRTSETVTTMPSAQAVFAFGLLGLLALGFAATAYWYGPGAIWRGVALLMIGALIVARLLPAHALAGNDLLESLGRVVRLRRFWVLVVVSCTINVCWHFLVNWLPAFLQDDRGMAFLTGGMWSALPFLAADAGNLGGGAMSRRLAATGLGTTRARLTVIAGCAALITLGTTVGSIGSDALVLAVLAIMAFGAAAFMANYFALCQDVSPRHTGLVVGILGGLGNLFAAGFSPVAGRIKDDVGNYGPVFWIVGLLPLIGLAALLLFWGRPEAEAAPKPRAIDDLA